MGDNGSGVNGPSCAGRARGASRARVLLCYQQLAFREVWALYTTTDTEMIIRRPRQSTDALNRVEELVTPNFDPLSSSNNFQKPLVYPAVRERERDLQLQSLGKVFRGHAKRGRGAWNR